MDVINVETTKMDQQQIILDQLKSINKHVAILNDELGETIVKIAVLENQVTELLWTQKVILGSILVAVIGAIFNVI